MSETMTYDPGTDTVTTEQNLTPEEQNSLEVGTEMENQQEQLLAGKYKNAQELEKAYAELEAKLGSKDTEETAEPEEKAEAAVDEEIGDVENPYNDDGSGTILGGDIIIPTATLNASEFAAFISFPISTNSPVSRFFCILCEDKESYLRGTPLSYIVNLP